MAAFDRAFYRCSDGRGLYARATTGGVAQFWRQAEMLETVEDAYARTHASTYRRMIGQLRAGITTRYGVDWLRDPYNDDVMWMVIAYLRAYELTGDRTYRTQARREFDGAYGRAHDATFGGGLWWTTSRHEKNACVNGPAAIAACLLARDLHAPSYLSKARALFAWLATTLYDPADGAVYDKIVRGGSRGTIDRSTYTYNQGTFIGAADLLGRATGVSSYRRRAALTLSFTRERLTVDGVLRSEGSGGDGGGFKGIFARWAAAFAEHHGLTDDEAWLDANAAAAWSRRNARGLIGEDWSRPTPPGRLQALDCSSAVALLEDRP
jgi:predicted alpha-1,6-mannanase (GH76 family)